MATEVTIASRYSYSAITVTTIRVFVALVEKIVLVIGSIDRSSNSDLKYFLLFSDP